MGDLPRPQVNIIGKIAGAKNFEFQTIYVKYNFLTGEEWKVIAGVTQGDTFQSTGMLNQVIPLEHPFDINYATKSIRGWPKLLVEAWGIDAQGRNSLGGYGIIGLPIQTGEYHLNIPCWRPRPEFSDTIIGSYPELVYKEVLVSSDSRFAFKTETTGFITVDIGIFTKDFNLHGVKLQQDEDDEDVLNN
ncbi:hypothetical protein ABPG72_007279 [Tetrahymena utriculariae]